MTLEQLAHARVVDLSHPISPDMPLWPGDPPVDFTPWTQHGSDGYLLQRFGMGEHTGTHLGVSAHMHPAGMTVERLPISQLVRPCVRFDLRDRVRNHPDATLTLADVRDFERVWRALPAGCVALLCTGWSARWPDRQTYLNPDAAGVMHFPGFSPEAVEALITQRDIAGLGIDAAGIDPGCDASLSANRLLLHAQRYHLENLTNLDAVPPIGAWLFVGALPLAGGSGSPARVLAIIEQPDKP
jgi:kynurenine formamidase